MCKKRESACDKKWEDLGKNTIVVKKRVCYTTVALNGRMPVNTDIVINDFLCDNR